MVLQFYLNILDLSQGFISRQRIIGERTRDGVLSVLSEDELKELLNDYKMYTDRISEEAIKSSHNYHDARNKSKNKLKLKCVESCEVFVNEKIDFDSLVIEIDGGKLSHTEISTKTPCIKTVNLSVKDEYGQKITKTVKINILEKEQRYCFLIYSFLVCLNFVLSHYKRKLYR